jgi:transcription termination/antitermination protein NusG
MSELKWYVLRAVSGQEKKVKSYLETEIKRRGIEQFIPQILIPSEKVYEIRNGKKYQRERTFFPGYVLIQADLNQPEVAPIVTNIPGVLGFLGSEGTSTSKKPIPLRQAEVNRILGKVDDESEKGETPAVSFIVGESVRIIDGGAFNGFIGVVEEVFDDRKKLNVIVKIFGRGTPMELNYVQVEKVE